jgi:glycosyltransferase involved in cell wall biosynthesis
MGRNPLSVLCDLRPAFDGFYGIAQETRAMFSLLLGWDGIEATGLINHPSLMLARALERGGSRRQSLTPAQRFDVLSRFVVSAIPRSGLRGIVRDGAATVAGMIWLQLLVKLGVQLPLDEFDGTEFGDFLWEALFSNSWSPADFERCREARYATLWAPWTAMHGTALIRWPRAYARVDTSGYDVLVAQTPWPGTIDTRTQLVIRYHDAVPLLLPHTIKNPRMHRYLHMSAMQENTRSAIFACVSESSRAQLLRIFPEIEPRSFVVHNNISECYSPVLEPRDVARDIIVSRSDSAVGTDHRRSVLFSDQEENDALRFILVVSTLEPRKNHLRLLEAWEALRSNSSQRAALVFVGSVGWSDRAVVRAMRKWQSRGELFHLSAVPESELRQLYAAATAVVCPSVSEGFDLPSVEAMRCGAALAVSDIPVHREILGGAAQYFDPYSVESMSDTLASLLASGDRQNELRRLALAQSEKFTSSNVRQQWQKVFDYCAARQLP